MKRVKEIAGKFRESIHQHPKRNIVIFGTAILLTLPAYALGTLSRADVGYAYSVSVQSTHDGTKTIEFVTGVSYPAEPIKSVAGDPTSVEETALDVIETPSPMDNWVPPTDIVPDLFEDHVPVGVDKSYGQPHVGARRPAEPPSEDTVDWSQLSADEAAELREAAGLELAALRAQRVPQPKPSPQPRTDKHPITVLTDPYRNIAELAPPADKAHVDVTPGPAEPSLKAPYNPLFPSMVKLRIVQDMGSHTETYHCGGTVVDNQWIVTAAHCVYDKDSGQMVLDMDDFSIEVTVASDLMRPGAIRKVDYAVVHAGFDYDRLSNDITMLKLDKPLPGAIKSAKLDDHRRPSVSVGGITLAAGFPVTGMKAGQQILQTVPLSIKKVEWPGYITVASPTNRVEGVCRGESGGPILGVANGRHQLAGILSGIEVGTENSQGEPCMQPGYEMYFTPIAAYRLWMDNVWFKCKTLEFGSCGENGPAGDFFTTPRSPGESNSFFLSSNNRS